jgi:hypothetical protein
MANDLDLSEEHSSKDEESRVAVAHTFTDPS